MLNSITGLRRSGSSGSICSTLRRMNASVPNLWTVSGQSTTTCTRPCRILPSFDALANELHYAIRKTEVLEVNARPITPPVRMEDHVSVDFGRRPGDGPRVHGRRTHGHLYAARHGRRQRGHDPAAGTILWVQAALSWYCRIFLEQGVFQAFQFYAAHERDIRQRLQEHSEGGRPLNEWRRAFFLDTSLRRHAARCWTWIINKTRIRMIGSAESAAGSGRTSGRKQADHRAVHR